MSKLSNFFKAKSGKLVEPEVTAKPSPQPKVEDKVGQSTHAKTSLDYKKLVHENETFKDVVVFNWCMGNLCNFKCSYCVPFLNDGSQRFPTLEEAKRFVNNAINLYDKKIGKKGKKFYFELTGGEITHWKDLPDFLDFLRENGYKAGLITNGSKPMTWWEKNVDKIDHVCLSYHFEFAKNDHFYQLVKFLKDKVRLHVNFMMLPEKFNNIFAFASKVKNLGNMSLALQPLIVDFDVKLFDYSTTQKNILDNQHEILSKYIKFDRDFENFRGAMCKVFEDGSKVTVSPQELISNNENNWQGWKCNIGIEQIVIDQDGSLYNGWCRVGGTIGNIYDAELDIPFTPVICNKSYCHCNLDVMCTKERIK